MKTKKLIVYTFGILVIAISLFNWFKISRTTGKASASVPTKNIALLTYYSNDKYGLELKNMTWKNKLDYAKQHNLDIYDLSENAEFNMIHAQLKPIMSFNPYVAKIIGVQLLLNMTHKNYDWVIWQDADSIFFNFSKDFHSVLDENYDLIISVGAPDNHQWKMVINTGCFAVKNSNFSRIYINDMLKLSEIGCKELSRIKPILLEPFNNWLRICNEDGSFWLSEQGANMVLYLFSEPSYTCHFKKVWFRVLLSEFPWYGEGDLGVHFPGRSNSFRRQMIQDFQKSNFKLGTIDPQSTELKSSFVNHGNSVKESDLLFNDYNAICT